MLESLAYFMILGVIAAAWLGAFIVDKIGFGSHVWASTIIGSVIGILILFIAPVEGGVIAMIAAGVCGIAASIILDKIW